MTDHPDEIRTSAGLLALMRLPGVGATKAIAYARDERSREELDVEAIEHSLELTKRQVENYARAGVNTLGFFDEEFPDALRAIPAHPAVIFWRGVVRAWEPPALAIVGTRRPTAFGRTATTELSAAAVEAGFSVISGLALGIDAVAHEAALNARGRTTAVLGSGLDTITPGQHRDLAERLLAGGGALMSEQPFDTEPSGRTLVARNRLQAGLAQALVVGQTGIEGGTMHTVRFAAEQGKPIYCPVPDESAAESQGLLALLETPANKLPDVLPAWAQAKALAAKLGDQPLARPVMHDDLASWAGELAALAAAEPSPPDAEAGQLSLGGL